MATAKELRAVAEAALRDWQTASTDPTLTNAELRRIKRTANEAHARWIEAATDTLSGGRYASQ